MCLFLNPMKQQTWVLLFAFFWFQRLLSHWTFSHRRGLRVEEEMFFLLLSHPMRLEVGRGEVAVDFNVQNGGWNITDAWAWLTAVDHCLLLADVAVSILSSEAVRESLDQPVFAVVHTQEIYSYRNYLFILQISWAGELGKQRWIRRSAQCSKIKKPFPSELMNFRLLS